jgi:hypothetical protein
MKKSAQDWENKAKNKGKETGNKAKDKLKGM